MGIKVLPPDINESNIVFTVSGNSIRFGLAAVKNVGRAAIVSIIKARKQKGAFVSFTDFCRKVWDVDAVEAGYQTSSGTNMNGGNSPTINKRAVESLIKAGAFDSIGHFRSQLLSVYEQIMDGVAQDRKRNLDGQISMFDMSGNSMSSVTDVVPDIKEFESKYLLAMEKEMTGLYLSGHPLMEYADELESCTSINTSEIVETTGEDQLETGGRMELDGKHVTMGGIITSVRIKATRNNSIMAFAVLEDMYGSIEMLIFPKILEKFNKLVQEDNLVLVTGRLNIREEETPKLLVENMQPLKKFNSSKLYLRIPSGRYNELVPEIKLLLMSSKGITPVYLCVEDENTSRKNVRVASKDLWVSINRDLIDKLSHMLGNESVKVC